MYLVLLLIIAIPSLIVLLHPLSILMARQKARRRSDNSSWRPSISLVVPLASTEQFAQENFCSYLTQKNDGSYEVIFVAEDPTQPSVRIASSLLSLHSNVNARILYSGPANENVSKMHNLCRAIQDCKNEIVVFVDSDVRLSNAEEIRELIGPLKDTEVGLITAAPQYHLPHTLGGHLLATMINADLWGYFSALTVLRKLNVANGAFLAMRRSTLISIGNLENLKRQVLSDTAIAKKVLNKRKRIFLSPNPLYIQTASLRVLDWWNQAIRWHIAMRMVLPKSEYLLYGLLRSPVLVGALSLLLWSNHPYRFVFLVLPILARIISFLGIQLAWIRQKSGLLGFLFVPFTDMISPLIWGYSWVQNQINWRGRTYRVQKEGVVIADD